MIATYDGGAAFAQRRNHASSAPVHSGQNWNGDLTLKCRFFLFSISRSSLLRRPRMSVAVRSGPSKELRRPSSCYGSGMRTAHTTNRGLWSSL